MKKFYILVFTLLFIGIVVSPASSAKIDLFDWAFYIDGTIYENFAGDSMPTLGTLDPASDLGILTWTTDIAGPHTFIAFFDYEIDEAINTFFNEYGAANGTPDTGQSWEIDEPGYLFGDIYDNLLTGSLDNTNAVPSSTPDDVSMAMGWNFTLDPLYESATVTLVLSDIIPRSGFYLSHTDPESDDCTVYYSSSLKMNPIPEPGTFILFLFGLAGFFGIKKKAA
ncbi:MAG: PEP-CTERM sorting domain-containing protein [bacterium]